MTVPDWLRSAWAPPERLTVSQWSDRYRYLPSTDPRPGLYSTAFMPYWGDPMDDFGDPRVEEIVIMAGAQVGKSRLLENLVGFVACEQPVNMMMVVARDEDAATVAKDRLAPMIEDSPAISRQLADGGAEKGAIRFRRCVLYMAAAGSASGLASKTAGVVLLDEIGKWKASLEHEGSPIELARQRTNAYAGRRKIVAVSSPTTERHGIYPEFARSDQRRFHLPCPHCGHYQPLVWEQVDFGDERDPDKIVDGNLAWYRCRSCNERWTDDHKREALPRGVWASKGARVTDDGEVEGGADSVVRGYHVTGLLSPLRPFSDFVARFLRARGSRSKLRVFFTSDVGRPHADVETAFEATDLKERTGDYELGSVPDEVEVLTCGVDVGKQALHWVIRGFRKGMDSWLVARGMASTLDDVEKMLDEEWGGMPIRLMCVDSGWKPEKVYRLAQRRKARCRAIKGASNRPKKPITSSSIETTSSGKTPVRGVKLFTLDTHFLKDELADLQEAGRWHLPGDIDEVYLEHLASERKELDQKGLEAWVPKSEGVANHFLDAEVYALAAARMLGVWKTSATAGAASRPAQPKPQAPSRESRPAERRRRGRAVPGSRRKTGRAKPFGGR